MRCLNDHPIVIVALGNEKKRYYIVMVTYQQSVLSFNSKEQCSLSEFEMVRGTLKAGQNMVSENNEHSR